MNNDIAILQATIDDLDQAAELFHQYRVFYDQDSDEERAKDFIRDRMILRESVIFMAREAESGQGVGFCQLYPTFSSITMQRSWILNDLFVVEEYRKRGIGKWLLDRATKYAKQTHSKGLALSTAKDNLRAQKIYEEHGYRRDETYYHYFLRI